MDFLMIVCTLVAVAIVAYFVLKNYNPIFTFFFSGLIILIGAFYLTGTPIPGANRKIEEITFLTNLLDGFAFITASFKKNLAGVGLIIMSVAGFAAYMKLILPTSLWVKSKTNISC